MSWGAPTRSRFAAPANCATVTVGVNVSWDAPAARRNSFEETPQGEIVEAVIVPLPVRLPSHQLPPKRPAIAGSAAALAALWFTDGSLKAELAAAYPGASPEVMITSVTAPLERKLGQMPGLTQMTSTSSAGSTPTRSWSS